MKEIIGALTKFQRGYEEKIPENTSALMAEIFSDRHDLLTLGTGSGEMCIGREEVTELIRSDWDGGWGDFKIDIEGAKIDADGDAAWFYADCTVEYSFEDSEERNKNSVDYVKEIIENQGATPKQRLSFLNWLLRLKYNQRKPGKREYLWPSELSGMLVKENGAWKIATLHFTIAKTSYPDERFEEPLENYLAAHNSTRDKIVAHEGNKANAQLLSMLKQLENELANDAELGGLCLDPQQVAVFEAGRFSWIVAIGAVKQKISEDKIFDRSLQEIEESINSGLPPEDKLFSIKRSIAYALKETALGTEFTYPIRLTAVVEKSEGGYKFRHRHFSYPFYWILEGKL